MNEPQNSITNEDILIVDDRPENLRLLSTMLLEQGYKIRQALSGKMAIKSVEKAIPDLILLDIMMSDMDGYEVCQRLKADERTAKIPVIFLSALNDVFDQVKGFTVGGADYITKPFQFEEVLVRVKNQLAIKAAEKEIHQLNAQLEERVKERTKQLEIANAKLREMAYHDRLTGLPNWALFMDNLAAALHRAKSDLSERFAVLFLDGDRFKMVNDSLGHSVGDELLIAMARRLETCLSQRDILARLGGDEFAIMIADIEENSSATQVAERILEALSHPFQLQRHEVFVSASIGIVLSNHDYEEPEHLLRDADTAMYRAKGLGKARYHIFDPAMHAAVLELLELENDLRRAVNQQEFVLHYQPIVDLKTGIISGFEALVRWHHPQKGLVSPGLFIPVAEETGLITSIGNWVLSEACRQLGLWQQQRLTDYPLTMSVNLSARQFAQPNLLEHLDEVLQSTLIKPQSIKLEITESAIMDNELAAREIIQQLRSRQIQLCIDDFGTGYSSLSYLHNFPVDILKIDRSFISRLDGNPENLGLVPAIANIAKTMGMEAIAEGIETEQQLAQLRACDCDFGQGYLFSKPVEGEKAMDLLAANPQW